MEHHKSNETVQTTETSLKIVAVLHELQEARLEDVVDHVDVGSSTVYRHLKTLQKHGYVVQEKGVYRIGLQFLTVGGYLRDRRPEYHLAKEMCETLAEKTGERAQFEVPEQNERFFVHTATGEQAVRAEGTIGRHGPLHCSSAGKAILSTFPDEQIRDIVDTQGLKRVTENTITDPDKLFAEIETIREEGVAFNRQESTVGLHAVAASVCKPDKKVLGALSVSAPAHRFQGERFTEDIPNMVRGASQELELNIEYSRVL